MPINSVEVLKKAIGRNGQAILEKLAPRPAFESETVETVAAPSLHIDDDDHFGRQKYAIALARLEYRLNKLSSDDENVASLQALLQELRHASQKDQGPDFFDLGIAAQKKVDDFLTDEKKKEPDLAEPYPVTPPLEPIDYSSIYQAEELSTHYIELDSILDPVKKAEFEQLRNAVRLKAESIFGNFTPGLLDDAGAKLTQTAIAKLEYRIAYSESDNAGEFKNLLASLRIHGQPINFFDLPTNIAEACDKFLSSEKKRELDEAREQLADEIESLESDIETIAKSLGEEYSGAGFAMISKSEQAELLKKEIKYTERQAIRSQFKKLAYLQKMQAEIGKVDDELTYDELSSAQRDFVKLQNVKLFVYSNVTQARLDAITNKKQSLFRALISKPIVRGTKDEYRQLLDTAVEDSEEEKLRKIFARNKKIREVAGKIAAVLGIIGGVIYAGAFFMDIFDPVGFAMSNPWFYGAFAPLAPVAIGIEVYCCYVGLPFSVDWILKNIFGLYANEAEYVAYQLSKAGLSYEVEVNAKGEAQYAFKANYPESLTHRLKRYGVGLLMVVGFLTLNAIGTMGFVYRKYHKNPPLSVLPEPLRSILAATFAVIMGLASYAFNFKRSIEQVPAVPKGKVNVRLKTDEEPELDGNGKPIFDYADRDELAKYQMATSWQDVKDFFSFPFKKPKEFGRALLSGLRVAASLVGALLPAIIIGGVGAFITITAIPGLENYFGIDTAGQLAQGVFWLVAIAVGGTQMIAIKGCWEDFWKNNAPKEAYEWIDETELNVEILLKSSAKEEKLDRNAFSRGWDSFKNFIERNGEWLAVIKAVSYVVGMGLAFLMPYFLGGGAGYTAVMIGGIAIAPQLVLPVAAVIFLLFGVYGFFLYRTDVKGEQTFTGFVKNIPTFVGLGAKGIFKDILYDKAIKPLWNWATSSSHDHEAGSKDQRDPLLNSSQNGDDQEPFNVETPTSTVRLSTISGSDNAKAPAQAGTTLPDPKARIDRIKSTLARM